MTSKTTTIAALAAGALVGAGLTAFALQGTSTATADVDLPPGFADQVRQVLVDNPDIVVDALTAYESQIEARQQEELRSALAANLDQIAATPGVHIMGNPDGKLVMVEFFDYHCGFCKTALPALTEMVESNPELGVAFIEFPILAPESEVAARAALAAGEQDRYVEMHTEMMLSNGLLTKERVLQMAGALGLDVARLEADMDSPKITGYLDAHMALADSLRIDGTPAFIIGDEPVTGWREDAIRQLVAQNTQ